MSDIPDGVPDLPADLTSVTTDDLVSELRNRFDALLFVGLKNTKTNEESTSIEYKSRTTALGLAKYAEHRLLRTKR